MEIEDQYILVISGWYPSYLEPLNGDFVKDQVALLRRHGQRVDVVYADLNIAYLARRQMSKRQYTHQDITGNNTTTISGPTWPKNTSWGLKQWIKSYAQLISEHISACGRPSLIHAHTYLGGAVAKCIADSHHIPYLITEHYTGWMTGHYRRSHLSIATSAFAHARAVTSVSSALADSLKSLAGISASVLPNFIDTTLFAPIDRQTTERLTVLGVGDLIPRKQWGHLIEAIKIIKSSFRQIQLYIIGEGSELGRLQQLVFSSELESVVTFTGIASKREVATAMHSADILVQCSHTETFGLTAIEALCSGLEVVTYDNGGAQAYAHLPGIHMIEEGHAEALAKILLDILKRLPSTYDYKCKVSDACKKEFSSEAVIPQLQTIYKNIINGTNFTKVV